ncbi:MAG: tyrosine-type recombinase/integrase [Armatimonadetes bacterium]|nr:tyrosine-type recombinase/integrase [Armatimonadota bacterium]
MRREGRPPSALSAPRKGSRSVNESQVPALFRETIPAVSPPAPLTPTGPAQAATDKDLLRLWLHGRTVNTQKAYRRDGFRFLDFTGKPLPAVTLSDLQAFQESLADYAPATRARILDAVKSLLAFGHRIGYLPFDVGRVLKLPPLKDTLAQRILTEAQVQRLLALETNPRNHLLLRLLYGAGLRVSELVALTWRDLQARSEGGQITVFGKGRKTRAILLPVSLWQDLTAMRGGASEDEPVFVSRQGKAQPLSLEQVKRIVRAAAHRAGISAPVSPHWLRHAHASHALDRGAPIHLVQATLGHASMTTTGHYAHARPEDSSARYLSV